MSKLSGRVMGCVRAVSLGKTAALISRAWHFIHHGPLQRELDDFSTRGQATDLISCSIGPYASGFR